MICTCSITPFLDLYDLYTSLLINNLIVLYHKVMFQALGISKYSLLGWSDGGVTSLIVAAMNTQAVQKLVVWGANAFVSDEDVEIYVGKIE